jgi:hypothetical protein
MSLFLVIFLVFMMSLFLVLLVLIIASIQHASCAAGCEGGPFRDQRRRPPGHFTVG